MTFKLPIFPLELTYKSVFILLSIILGLLMPYLSFDYGITEDARLHHEHGKRLLDYFKGLDGTAKLSPLDDSGKLINVSISQFNQNMGMNAFGGFFDLCSNFFHQFFSFTGEYEFRNILNSVFAFLLFLFCGLLGKEIGGWRDGVLCFLFTILTPVLFGHGMCNPKDIPFAAFYIFSVFHMVKLLKELPVISIKRAVYLIINLSLLLNIRLIGLVMMGHIVLAFFVWWGIQNYHKGLKNGINRDNIILFIKISTICIMGYLATSIFWPYLHSNPIMGPIELFRATKDFKGFVSIQLFEGTWNNSYEMPWYYMIKSLLIIAVPLYVFFGYFLYPLLYFKQKVEDKLLVSFILFTSIFPLFFLVLSNPNSYDHGRQFFFVLPSLVVCGGLSWTRFTCLIVNKQVKWLVFVIMFVLLLQPLRFMIRNHPLESQYFSPIVGGVEGAYGKYEIDYWGFAIKPAIDWLAEHIEEASSPARVRMYYGEQIKLRYYTEKIPSLNYVAAAPKSPDWDYSIVMLTEAKFNKDLLNNWPPKHTVHEVKVDGVTVAAIVKNTFVPKDATVTLEQQLLKAPTSAGYIRLSVMYYQKKTYLKSIMASKKAIAIDEKNSVAYNNLCSAYNMLLMYDRAKEACENSLKYAPSTLAVNNLKMAQDGIAKEKRAGLTNAQYTGLSYNYYQLQDFEGCIRASKAMLLNDPKNYVAYNNICASHNSLQNFEQAAIACQKALELNPDSQLAKNNLKYSQESLSK